MKRRTRILCLILAGVMLFGVLFAILSAVAFAAVPGEKSETVYVSLDASGKPKSVRVSVCLTNPLGEATLEDATALSNLSLVGDGEAPKEQADGTWRFETEGEDVYYQGEASPGRLPLRMEVGYTLDGRKISPEALAGKSGRVGITVSYKNLHTRPASIEGKNVSLYTPFTVVTMITLDGKFTNLEAVNAKIMAEAGVNTVTGITFPGLAENIEAEPKDRLAEKFTVYADVEAFELESITAIAMTGLMDADDLSDVDDMQEMIDGMDEMTEAGDELYDGTKDLYKGARDFEDGLGEYLDGLRELYEGSMEASDGATELWEGVEELADGARELASGASELADGVDTLYSQLSGAGSGGTSGGIDQNAATEALGTIAQSMSASILGALGDAAAGLSEEQQGSLQAAIATGLQSAYTKGAEAAGAAAGSALTTQMNQLLAGIAELAEGADELADGAWEMAKGVAELADGTEDFREGMIDIEEALRELDENGVELRDGVDALADGIRELRDGVQEFNEEGIQELASNTDEVEILLDRKDAMLAQGEAYDSFAGKAEGVTGSVKFVFETESIFFEKPLETAPPPGVEASAAAPEEELGFFARIWRWITGRFGAG